jgi:hypothetical protein
MTRGGAAILIALLALAALTAPAAARSDALPPAGGDDCGALPAAAPVTTIIEDPADVPGVAEEPCGCLPWWHWPLIVFAGVAGLIALYATHRVFRGR